MRIDEDVGPLRLQPDECDCAVWVPLDDVAVRLCSEGDADAGVDREYAAAVPVGGRVASRSLAGVYPNSMEEGIGRGHLWAIRTLRESLHERYWNA